MIGIYKITNPTSKIYIGQSIDLKYRENQYKRANCHQQIKLYNSIKKYGWNKHKFEIIEECDINKLDERELYWGEYYDVLGENGLVLRLGNGRGKCSEETKKKKSIAMKGKKQSEEHKRKRFENRKNNGGNQKISISKYKSVLKLDPNTNGILAEYNSISEANIDCGKNLRHSSIGLVCRGKYKTAFGFGWKYKE